MSERSLLPVLIPATLGTFRTEFRLVLGGILRAVGVEEALISRELLAADEIVFACTRNRQVLGVMNDFARMVEDYLSRLDGIDAAVKASLWLAETPSKPIGYESPDRFVRGLIGAKHRA